MQGHGEKRTPDGNPGAVACKEEGGGQEEAGGGAGGTEAAGGNAAAERAARGGKPDTHSEHGASGVYAAAEYVPVWGESASTAGRAGAARVLDADVPCVYTAASEPVHGAAAGLCKQQRVQAAYGGGGPGCRGGAGSRDLWMTSGYL
ncbi:unnamed protein product [Pneumocystis jirovecii]|uniref:Uncharacterized protein n=1 Tax=Pneumocystis jirovecii TaxID=42068 RepID=L0PE44_PNEJI|nr:unnamed protein product [Pneumocystis jirovecii]